MPLISNFYGISIYMYFAEHQPPHFHAVYGEFEAVIRITDLSIIGGRLPSRAERLVADWASQH